MNYIGSKLRLLDFLEKSIKEVVGDGEHCICDLFAGTGTVGIHFKKLGYQVTSNDLQYYSYIINKHYIQNNEVFKFENLLDEIVDLNNVEEGKRINAVCDYLSNLPLVGGFIYSSSRSTLAPALMSRARWMRLRSPPDIRPTLRCCTSPVKPKRAA